MTTEKPPLSTPFLVFLLFWPFVLIVILGIWAR